MNYEDVSANPVARNDRTLARLRGRPFTQLLAERHVSHLWGLFPDFEITEQGTPKLFAAAQRSLELRGDEGTGWSKAWKISFWARLQDGDHADRLIQSMTRPTRERRVSEGGGVYPNLFDAHGTSSGCRPASPRDSSNSSRSARDLLARANERWIG